METTTKHYNRLARSKRKVEESSFADVLTMQVAISIFLIVFVFAISKIESSVTNSLNQSLQYAISKQMSAEEVKKMIAEATSATKSIALYISKFLNGGGAESNDTETTAPVMNTQDAVVDDEILNQLEDEASKKQEAPAAIQ